MEKLPVYFIPGYFGPLAKKVGLLYYPLEINSHDTIHTKLLQEKPHCARKMLELQIIVKNNKIRNEKLLANNGSSIIPELLT